VLACVIVATTALASYSLYAYHSSQQSLRLIQFSETEKRWMSQDEVEKMAAECGAEGHHGGFFDITDHPNFSPADLKVKIPHDFPDPRYQTFVKQLFPLMNRQNLIDNNNALSSFRTRYYTTETGRQAADLIKATFEEYADGRSDVTVTHYTHSWLQPSVIARVTGTVLPNIVVIIGAHEDSINGGAQGVAPGADDDASGVVIILEAFRVLMLSGWKPEVSVEFMTYAAEEVGLRGSQAIAVDYQSENREVYAVMQLDMAMFNPADQIGIIGDFCDPDLTAFLRRIVEEYSDLPWVATTCGYACSDHASWHRAGYAVCYPKESHQSVRNPNLHTTRDTISILDPDHGLQFVRVVIGWFVELAGIGNK